MKKGTPPRLYRRYPLGLPAGTITAIGPGGACYADYDSIPPIPRPWLIVVKNSVVCIDDWAIRIVDCNEFHIFMAKRCCGWIREGSCKTQAHAVLDAIDLECLKFQKPGRLIWGT